MRTFHMTKKRVECLHTLGPWFALNKPFFSRLAFDSKKAKNFLYWFFVYRLFSERVWVDEGQVLIECSVIRSLPLICWLKLFNEFTRNINVRVQTPINSTFTIIYCSKLVWWLKQHQRRCRCTMLWRPKVNPTHNNIPVCNNTAVPFISA